MTGDRDEALSEVLAWAKAAAAVREVAATLCKTSFVSLEMHGKVDDCTAAILAGAEVGLAPMAAVKAFDLIDGQAAPKAITLRAIVQSAGHEIWVSESTRSKAVVQGRRRGSEHVITSTWTIERAQRAGYATRAEWVSMPEPLLLARATAECARLTAADAILGVAYSSEELRDLGPAATATVSRAKAGPRKVSRAKKDPAEIPVPPLVTAPFPPNEPVKPATRTLKRAPRAKAAKVVAPVEAVAE